MEQVNNLPMMNPEIVTAIGFMLLFITFKIRKRLCDNASGTYRVLYTVCNFVGYAKNPFT